MHKETHTETKTLCKGTFDLVYKLIVHVLFNTVFVLLLFCHRVNQYVLIRSKKKNNKKKSVLEFIQMYLNGLYRVNGETALFNKLVVTDVSVQSKNQVQANSPIKSDLEAIHAS